VICARRTDRLVEARDRIERLGRRCLAVPADVSQPEHCQRVVDKAIHEFGQVDILVNNAGVAPVTPSTREDPQAFRRVLDVNIGGAYWTSQACARVMAPGSSIVSIGSILSRTTFTGVPQAAYSASKAAINGLTRSLAQQWTGRKGIRVNGLAPGIFPSEATAGHNTSELLWRVPMGRVGELREIVDPLLFLVSDAASYVSGTVLVVDGGLLTN
jgi:NAD(P)-dependent dehydrogenase (short-subunit alcohol dehydrogenase family)